jgi:thioredoxin-like negative regulator of GroEL
MVGIGAEQLSVVLVTRATSGVGRRMESVLARLQVREHHALSIRRVDADLQPGAVERLHVCEIPTILLMVGSQTAAELRGRATLEDLQMALAHVRGGSAAHSP